jgi:hypothetical protein
MQVISKEEYERILSGDSVESFELFLKHRYYINADAGNNGEYKVAVAIYQFDEPVSNTSWLHGDWDYKTGADAIEYRAFDTNQEAFAWAMSFGTRFVADLENSV